MESPIIPEETLSKLQQDCSGSVLYHFAVVKSLAKDDAEKVTTAIYFERAGIWNPD
jgi:hypothetical protein